MQKKRKGQLKFSHLNNIPKVWQFELALKKKKKKANNIYS